MEHLYGYMKDHYAYLDSQIEEYVARIYAARVPLTSMIGNYQRLPGKKYWKPELMELLKPTLEMLELLFKRVVDEHPDGAKAQPHFDDMMKYKKLVLETEDAKFKKGMGGN